jgi:hypothetical protein
MKYTIKNIISAALFLGVVVFSLTSCYETHYYHENHHHTREWYERHHTPPPEGVRFDVDVRH